jgi:hypothetical protein
MITSNEDIITLTIVFYDFNHNVFKNTQLVL